MAQPGHLPNEHGGCIMHIQVLVWNGRLHKINDGIEVPTFLPDLKLWNFYFKLNYV